MKKMDARDLIKSPLGRTSKLLKMVGQIAKEEISRQIKEKVQKVQELEAGPLARIKQAQILVNELGHLKGAAMKLGQIIVLEARSYLPDEVCQVLEKIQAETSFLDFAQIEKILQEELKNSYPDFASIETRPLAAASIGQVHRARLKGDPTDLVVKVQYPGICDTIDSDIKVMGTLMKTLTTLTRKDFELEGLLQEFAEIFLQESDYLQEAKFATEYKNRVASSNLQGVIVPEIYSAYSTQKVLTMKYEQGLALPLWLRTERPSAELREYYARLILEIYTHEFCHWGLVQTDPNLGNFLFRPQTRELVLLDFGATKVYDQEFRQLYSKLIMAIFNKQDQLVMDHAVKMQLIDPRESAKAQQIFQSLVYESMRPLTVNRYNFTEGDYSLRVQKLSRELTFALKFSPPPKNLIFLHRKLAGIFQILRTLEVQMDLRDYIRPFEQLASAN